MRAYILEHTRDIFVGQPDEPCSRAAHLEPTNSGADPLRSAASMAATHSPSAQKLILRPLRRSKLDLGPHRRRGTRERLGLRCPG
jgi:hypothetical protein